MMTWAQIQLQDACSPVMEELIFFHDFTLVVLTTILTLVGLSLYFTIRNNYMDLNFMNSQMLEFIWTVAPVLILIEIAIPSLMLLYIMEETSDSAISVKVMGHQWYWSYEYSDFWLKDSPMEFDSYMLKNLSKKTPIRLLETDNRVCLPTETPVQLLISSSDVLHSWTVPSMGIKSDACPGRLNQLKLISHRPGVYFGQCSEICGANHSFMPICMELISPKYFMNWLNAMMKQ